MQGTTHLVNVRVAHLRPHYNNLQEWIANPNNIYIGRRGIVFIDGARYPPHDSIFANPFKVPRDGTLEEVIAKYEAFIVTKIETGLIRHEDIENLRGKNLGCWCKNSGEDDVQCHGDVLLRILDVWEEHHRDIEHHPRLPSDQDKTLF